jgi:hypothetical protein
MNKTIRYDQRPANYPQEQIDQALEGDAIEQMLRDSARADRDIHIDNAGFSDRVMEQVNSMPPPRNSALLAARMRLIIFSTALLAALALVLTVGQGHAFIIDAVMDIATRHISAAVLGLLLLIVSAISMMLLLINMEK